MEENRPDNPIARRDELLELFYWLEGEGLQASATVDAIARFVAIDPAAVRETLDQLVRRGDIMAADAQGEYRLTSAGRVEAARRFAQEFAPLLSQGHGECSDPDCDCHHDPAAAVECHAERAHRSHSHR
ncbi:MAG: hypothetical protein ACT4OZ_01440 [Gemmatimonadota bacterium]